MKNLYEKFHNLFSVSKTLRFELIPIGKTKIFFEEHILAEDEKKAKLYKKIKKYCDEYHKCFINDCLENIEDKDFESLLKKYEELFNKQSQNEKDEEEFKNIQNQLRKKLSERFTKHHKYKSLFGKDMININLKEYYADNKEILDELTIFEKFTTYFSGFDTNRENMYSSEEKHTAIGYRLIDENLTIYINNINAFKKILENIPNIKDNIKTNLGLDCDRYFLNIENYKYVLTQKQIEEYNLLISGKAEADKKIKGINEIVNEYIQDTKIKIPKLRQLYKQILSDTNSVSFKFDIIEFDKQIIEMISNYYNLFKVNFIDKKLLQIIFENIEGYNTKAIYINNDTTLTQFSKNVYSDWSYINYLLSIDYDKNYKGKAVYGTEKYTEQKEKELKKIKELSIYRIEELIQNNDKDSGNHGKIYEYLKTVINEYFYKINETYKDIEPILQEKYTETSIQLIQKSDAIEKIKNFLDSIKNLQTFVKYFIPKNKSIETDLDFYNSLNYDILEEIIPIYNKTRNYLTKKPYSIEKFKLNFDCPTFLSGWDLNKEEANLGTLFLKDNKYYVGILNKENKRIFINKENGNNGKLYKKIEYKLLPGPNKMLPKVFFSESRKKDFTPSEELLLKYNKGLHKKGATFDINFCHELIDFYKKSISIHEDWSKFNFHFSETSTYQDISQFYKEVEQQGYKITYTDVSENYINQLVDEGKLYLFQIYNKDFSKFSKGIPNLHTMYWRALFDEDNLKNVIYQLNGGAEIFYRKKSIEPKITHYKNQPIENKNPDNPKRYSTFNIDLIKDKRFGFDKFQFHVPITLNFKAKGENKFNNYTNNEIRNTDDINIIGIDRGERHLLYISVINQKGEILEQKSLNKIGITDYHKLLETREDDNKKSRQSWGTIQNIKELKEGYMSQVVHEITNLMFKYNAIIVLEDLNSGFKNSRKKIEKAIYDKFETKLIDKLNYLVNKSTKNKFEQGGIMNAYQFTNKDIKNTKQNGLIFYIPAWCTSKIDPTTGFVNLFDTKRINTEFIQKFDSIIFNEQENYFEFHFDYRKFSDKSCGKRTNWVLCTYGERIRTFRNPLNNNEWDNEKVNLTNEFKNLFKRYNIDLSNIKSEIINKSDSKFYSAVKEKDGFYGFSILFRVLIQLRNSFIKSEKDYILSPVKNKKGFFYDSRIHNNILPENADANGAYNIARKGLIILNRIKNSTDNEKIDYNIKNSDWLEYVQGYDH